MVFPRIDELGEMHPRPSGMTVNEVKAAKLDREGLRSASIAAAHGAIETFSRHLDNIRNDLGKY